jgi:hypothetical protein
MKPSDYIRKGWTQEAYARNKAGNSVGSHSPNAVSWCLYGALVAAYPDDAEWIKVYNKVLFQIQKKSPYDIPAAWNDRPGRTQAEVILLLESVGE